MPNLDTLAAETAHQILDDTKSVKSGEVDNLATRALGVLQENGVYAALLYLYSRTGPDAAIAPHVRTRLLNLAAAQVLHQDAPPEQVNEAQRFVTEQIANDLDTLLLVKQVWEQTLIYVRYGAKARESGS